MTYSFEQMEYTTEDGITLSLDGCVECEVSCQKEEPQTWEDPGCPAEVIVESIDSVNIETINLGVNLEIVGSLNIGDIDATFLKKLEAWIEKESGVLEDAQAYAMTEDAQDYEPQH